MKSSHPTRYPGYIMNEPNRAELFGNNEGLVSGFNLRDGHAHVIPQNVHNYLDVGKQGAKPQLSGRVQIHRTLQIWNYEFSQVLSIFHYLWALVLSTKDAESNHTQQLPSGGAHSLERLTQMQITSTKVHFSGSGGDRQKEMIIPCEGQ